MAQRKTIVRQTKALARRLGLIGGRAVAVIGTVLLAVAVGMGILGHSRSYVTVERDEETVQMGEDAADGKGQMPKADSEQSEERDQDESAAEPLELVVHVDGAVTNPGVYVVEGEAPRINDAVMLAGGLLPEADTSSLNLAQPLLDGQKVHVPVVGEEVAQSSVQDLPVQEVSVSAQGDADGSRINVNSATVDDLQRLPGVGAATAASIVDDRERNGPFLSVEDLMRVSGIGEKKFEKMRDMVYV